MTSKILRLKLTDFIGTKIENDVIRFLHMIKENAPVFVVECWYEPSDLKLKDLDVFIEKYKKQIDEIEIAFHELNSYETAVWYDIISIKDESLLSHYKFRATYENTSDMIECIFEFNNLIKFEMQKNMSYNKHGQNKDAKDSNNRFKKMGKST